VWTISQTGYNVKVVNAVAVVDGTKPYDVRSFPIPRNGLELGQEKSPGHNGSFLKVNLSTVCLVLVVRMLLAAAWICVDLPTWNIERLHALWIVEWSKSFQCAVLLFCPYIIPS